MELTEYKGYNGTFILSDNGVEIKRGASGFLLGGGMLRGNKTIPYSSIVAVQMKKGGMTAGYLQLTLMGGSEAKGGVFQAAQDENTVMFYKKGNEKFAEAKQAIEERMGNKGQGSSNLNDLEKLSELRVKGVITEEEFALKKKQLLGI